MCFNVFMPFIQDCFKLRMHSTMLLLVNGPLKYCYSRKKKLIFIFQVNLLSETSIRK